jgi:hypothetical protein
MHRASSTEGLEDVFLFSSHFLFFLSRQHLCPTTQADQASLLTADSVKSTVASMLGESGGPLSEALSAKLNAADAFTRDDAIAVVDDLVNGAVGEGEGDTLRGVLDSLTERIVMLEDIADETCGRHCRAGEYVKSVCTDNSPTVCEVCPSEQFSFGGLPHACNECGT